MNDLQVVPTFNNPTVKIYERFKVEYEMKIKNFDKKSIEEFRWEKFEYTSDYYGHDKKPEFDKKRYFNMYHKNKIHHTIFKFIPENQWDIFVKLGKSDSYNISVYDKNFRNIILTIYYTEIEEQIIQLLIAHKCSDEILINDLRMLFMKGNCDTLKEYVDKKSKYLLSLDMNDYIKELNKSTEDKRHSKIK